MREHMVRRDAGSHTGQAAAGTATAWPVRQSNALNASLAMPLPQRAVCAVRSDSGASVRNWAGSAKGGGSAPPFQCAALEQREEELLDQLEQQISGQLADESPQHC